MLMGSRKPFAVNDKLYEKLDTLGKGGSSTVYSVLDLASRNVLALKRLRLEGVDQETYQSYMNEIKLLQRLNGHDRIVQLVDHQITFNNSKRPKILTMVMERGEIDFAMLLDQQRGRPLDLNFVGLYWKQVSERDRR
jgi:serine/threonine-protein kinase TTK/MPS1